MREIKFRCWFDASSYELEGVDFGKSRMMSWEDINNDEDSLDNYFEESIRGMSSLMQYTGLKDKNGVEVFEGDVYHHGDIGILYKVIFQDGQFLGNQIGNKSTAGLDYWLDRTEVIGNIYENPELLKG